ncbi:MAG: hypothetical protein M1536_02940 [Firmicutes bacterium]|nr:hypothetical protein [Bacillota bacterium]
MNIWTVAAIVFALNLPFGYWRANVNRFSGQWFLSVHIPIPVIITIRILSGIGWHLITIPVTAGAFLLGQLLGGQIHYQLKKIFKIPLSSCLFCDLMKNIKNACSR